MCSLPLANDIESDVIMVIHAMTYANDVWKHRSVVYRVLLL